MTREDVIRMAREAGGAFIGEPDPEMVEILKRLIFQATATEREACAAVAEDSDHIAEAKHTYYAQLGDASATASNIADAIRARGEKA